MFLCQFDNHKLGMVDSGMVRDVTSVLEALPVQRYPFPTTDLFIEALPQLRERISVAAARSVAIPLSEVRLLRPVANPGKVIGAPVNYQKHLDEVGADPNLHQQNKAHTAAIHQAGLFLKATSSLIGPSEEIVIRHQDRRTDHEVELAVVIGKRANAISQSNALDYVAGYCIGLDITVRGPEDRSFRKSIDTYSVLGPWLVTADHIPDPGDLDLSITVNGQLRQKSNTRNLILGIQQLLEFASAFYTLYPGDVIMTGTPEGVGPIEPGDVLHASITSIGEMTVHVKK